MHHKPVDAARHPSLSASDPDVSTDLDLRQTAFAKQHGQIPVLHYPDGLVDHVCLLAGGRKGRMPRGKALGHGAPHIALHTREPLQQKMHETATRRCMCRVAT